jgi:fatty acid desaturase
MDFQNNYRKDIHMSRNRVLYSKIGNFFLNIHNEGFHLVHHLYPNMPSWNLKKAHKILMEDNEYQIILCNRITTVKNLFEQLFIFELKE